MQARNKQGNKIKEEYFRHKIKILPNRIDTFIVSPKIVEIE